MKMQQLFYSFLLLLGVSLHLRAEDQLHFRLRQLAQQVQQGNMEFTNIESSYLGLFKDCSTPEDKGKVYLALVNSDGFFHPSRPEKIVEYCEQALKFPQSIPDTCDIFLTWGAALRDQNRAALNDPGKIAQVRRLIVGPWLKCMAIIQTNQVPDKWQDPPWVGGLVYNGPRTNAYYLSLIKERDEQIKKRQQVDLGNALIDYRDSYMAAIAELYRLPPEDWQGLKADADEEMHDQAAADAFVEKIKSLKPGGR